MKIAMVVFNTVSKDARVLKEAESLVSAGHQVRIFGIHDNTSNADFDYTENGFEIERVFWRHNVFKITAFLLTLLTLCLIPLTYILINFIAISMYNAFINNELFIYSYDEVSIILIKIIIFLPFLILLRSMIKKIKRLVGLYYSYKPGGYRSNKASLSLNIVKRYQYIFKRLIASISMSSCIFPRVIKYQPDVIHCHDLPAVPLGVIVKKKLSIPIVYDSHEIYEEQASFGKLNKIIFTLIQKNISKHVDYFITINESINDFLRKKYPSLPPAVIVMNATKQVYDEVSYDGRLHKAANLDEDVKILLYQGGFGPRRGLSTLVKSSKFLPENWVLVMMGWGSLESSLKKIACDIDPAGEKIRFIPSAPHSELRDWTAGASLGVIPYEKVNMNHWFCTPNKLWEYPNSGVPILASNFPEMAKIINKYNIGYFLPENFCEKDIANTISALDDEELNKKAANCYKFVSVNNWSIYENNLVNLYAEIGNLN